MSVSAQAALVALDEAEALRDDLVSEGSTWSLTRIERKLAGVRATLQTSVVAVRAQHAADGWPAVDGLLGVARDLAALALAIASDRARIVTREMPRRGSAAHAALWLLGDASRRDEIIRLNQLRDPLVIEAGTELQVPER